MLGHGMKLRHMHCFECALCGELVYDKKKADNAFKAIMFGAVNYGVCPLCLAEKNPDNKEWRAKVDKWVAERRAAYERAKNSKAL